MKRISPIAWKSNSSNGFVAAWLPGTEGDGVEEVLFGDYPFTGQLSFTWPTNMSQIPINIGDATYNPLFEYGYPSSLDLQEFCYSWLEVPGNPGYDPRANFYDDLLDIIDFLDYAIFAGE